MFCKASGQLFHHFWGDYCADIILFFENADQAAAVANSGLLNNEAWGVWKLGKKDPTCMVINVNSDQLSILKKCLGDLGADTEKISSLKYSVDHGEEFEIEMEIKGEL
jgi:hypothetical protein